MRRIVVFVLLVQGFCWIKVSAQKDIQHKESTILANNEFAITGKLIGRDTGSIVLLYFDKTGKFVKDTATLNRGTFKFKGSITEPTRAQLVGDLTSTRMSDPNKTVVFLEPGYLQLELTEGHFLNANLLGSNTQNEFDKFHKMQESLKLAGDSLTIDFFTSHPNSYVSPLLMWEANDGNQVTYELIKSAYNKLSDGPKNSFYGRLIDKKIKAKDGVVVGKSSPVLVAKDMNGKVFSLE